MITDIHESKSFTTNNINKKMCWMDNKMLTIYYIPIGKKNTKTY